MQASYPAACFQQVFILTLDCCIVTTKLMTCKNYSMLEAMGMLKFNGDMSSSSSSINKQGGSRCWTCRMEADLFAGLLKKVPGSCCSFLAYMQLPLQLQLREIRVPCPICTPALNNLQPAVAF